MNSGKTENKIAGQQTLRKEKLLSFPPHYSAHSRKA